MNVYVAGNTPIVYIGGAPYEATQRITEEEKESLLKNPRPVFISKDRLVMRITRDIEFKRTGQPLHDGMELYVGENTDDQVVKDFLEPVTVDNGYAPLLEVVDRFRDVIIALGRKYSPYDQILSPDIWEGIRSALYIISIDLDNDEWIQELDE